MYGTEQLVKYYSPYRWVSDPNSHYAPLIISKTIQYEMQY